MHPLAGDVGACRDHHVARLERGDRRSQRKRVSAHGLYCHRSPGPHGGQHNAEATERGKQQTERLAYATNRQPHVH